MEKPGSAKCPKSGPLSERPATCQDEWFTQRFAFADNIDCFCVA